MPWRVPPPAEAGLRPISLRLNEWLGAFGDLGTFAPIYLELVALCGLPPGRAMVLFGLAIYAVSDVARDHFGAGTRRATARNLALSLGVSNLAIGACGGLPVCHGSGGLSAHYGFGARSGGATLIMGSLRILLGLALPQDAPRLIALLPPWVLGLLLLYPGVCHVLLVRKLEARVPLAVVMGLIGAATGNLAYALAFGLAGQAVLDRRLVPA